MRRVVVTGMGAVSPLGVGANSSFEALLAQRSGVSAIRSFSVDDLPCKIAGQVPRGEAAGQFNPASFLSKQEIRRYQDFIQYAVAAADEATLEAGWRPQASIAQAS